MDEYSIYWLKDVVTEEFFYKGGVLYQFFEQARLKKDDRMYQKQYDYITKKFVAEDLIDHFKRLCLNGQVIEINNQHLQITRDNQIITLQIYNKHLQFRCRTLKDAEELLFPILRDFHSSLFVAGENVHNFGWITPRKIVKKYQPSERLYSIEKTKRRIEII
jgi:hypothetical protein